MLLPSRLERAQSAVHSFLRRQNWLCTVSHALIRRVGEHGNNVAGLPQKREDRVEDVLSDGDGLHVRLDSTT